MMEILIAVIAGFLTGVIFTWWCDAGRMWWALRQDRKTIPKTPDRKDSV